MKILLNDPVPAASVRPILLVEDSLIDIDFVVQALIDNQVANPLRVCRDGVEALAYVGRRGSPADPELPLLVLLDLNLPLLHGMEVLRQARRHPVWRLIPVLMLSNACEAADVNGAYALGANGYVVKPLSYDAFAVTVGHIKNFWLGVNRMPLAPISSSFSP